MINFLKYFAFFFVAFETSFVFWFFFDNEVTSHEYFILEFVFVLIFNKYLDYDQYKLKFNIDIIFKFFLLMLKTPSFFFNYLINIFRKIFVFLYYYKYRDILNTFRIYSRKYSYRYFSIWRPLFKKTSYYGYYRSNRSKWIK